MMGMHDFQYNMLTTNFNIVGHSLGGQLRLMTRSYFREAVRNCHLPQPGAGPLLDRYPTK